MNARIVLLDRIIVLLVGLSVLAGGAWAVGLFLDIPLAQGLADRIDSPAWLTAPSTGWFDPVLIVVGLLSAVLGGWLIALNLRRYRIGRVVSPASDALGSIEIDLATLATAVARQLEEHPRVESVQATVTDSWDRPTLTLTLRAHADTDVPALRAALNQTERDVRAAVPGIDVDTVYRLHLYPVES
ncbi:hypothetical protein EAH68_04715 [Corynebacterium hylobatis]|uniref:Alkaline shock response membrane anchor protein AmaP n=1 Tax=Corynebacterium hylobatis TaxID=1859290 RepID=A0A430I0D9_9CORY|nr:hypothetical protein [Corynebacterium hylobatis]RSZ64308.1 hypothetical protein EAH68_04715 [Corynebacterium hylobatis]